MQFGRIRLAIHKRLITRNAHEVHLTPIEFEVFNRLALDPGGSLPIEYF